MREAESSLRKLSRHLQALNTQHGEAVYAHDAGKHAAAMVELDTKKFRIAKAASELEIESERLESELDMLKERLADLEAQGVEGDEQTRREREADDAILWVRLWIGVIWV
jgi:kinetochore protein Spc24